MSTSLIPESCTFLNPATLVSKKAKDMIVDLLKAADNRNPELHNMYIYNDFHNYAIMDLIDRTLSTLHTKIVKKAWDDAFIYLEALSIFMDIENSWPMCDDGDRVNITDKVYGASLVTVLRALKNEERLDVVNFPSLETLLKTAANWGSAMKGLCTESNYHTICKAIGRRLFKDKSAEVIAMEKARSEEWIRSLDKRDQERITVIAKGQEEDQDTTEDQPWFHEGRAVDEGEKDRNYTLSRVWKEYKEYLSSIPNVPLLGPPSWDISVWPVNEKEPFMY